MTVYLVGSINADILVFAERFPAVGETLKGLSWERQLGGKGANQAVAAVRAGSRAVLLGAVGDDDGGDSLRRGLADYGVDVDRVGTVKGASGLALVTVAGGDNRILVVPGANEGIDPAAVAELPLQAGDVCVAQWETRGAVVAAAFERARARRAVTLFNPAPAEAAARELFALADLIVVNETEFAAFTGLPAAAAGDPAIIRRGRQLLGLRRPQALIVTLGAAGCAAQWEERSVVLPGYPVAAVDATGAGDCFCGYLAAGLDQGQELEAALAWANAAAALAVQGRGAAAAMPDRMRVEDWLSRRSGSV
jgi:ribokinase